MKYILLVYLVGLVLIILGVSEVGDYSLSIEGPPPLDGLPELSYGKDQPIFAQREILESSLPKRSLIYKFHLPAGSYSHLWWNGHGVALPPSISICDCWGRVVFRQLTADNFPDLLASSKYPVTLPQAGVFSVLKWFISKVSGWLLATLVLLSFRKPLAGWVGRFLGRPSHRFRFRLIEGKVAVLTMIALTPVWVLLLAPGAIRFDVGDDPAMEMLSSGYVTGHPSEYLIFINVLIGLFLKGLYLFVPAVPWYPAIFLAVTLASLTGMTALVLREDLPDRFCWLCLFGVVFGTYFVMHVQFTSMAYLLGLFGMLIFSRMTSRGSLVVAVALVVAGSLVRFESFLLLLLTTACAAWLLSPRVIMDKSIFFAAILFLGWAGHAFDHVYYDRSADWKAYREYNGFRGDLNSTPKLNFGAQNKPYFEHVGWSQNDFDMFNIHWLNEDPAAFSADKLAYLDQHLDSNRRWIDILLNLLMAIALAPVPVLLFFTILLQRTHNKKISLLQLALIIGPPLLALAYLADSSRLPARVLVPPLYAASLFLVMAVRDGGRTWRSLTFTPALPLLFVTLVVLSLGIAWSSAIQNDQETKRLNASLQRLAAYSGQTLIGSINSVRLEGLAPLNALAETRNLAIIHLMWSGGSPSFQQQLHRHGSESLFQSMANDPHFWLLIPTSDWGRAASFSQYMQEHYHKQIVMTPVVLSDGRTAVFPDFTVMKVVHESQP